MYVQSGSVSDANTRLPKMGVIENTIPNTIPVNTVFMGKLLASSGTSPFATMSKMRRWCCAIGHRGDLPLARCGHAFAARFKMFAQG
jgi:hypothetical protein